MSGPRARGVDRWLHGLRPGAARTSAWVAVDLGVLLATSVLALALVALPPLSLLPSQEPLRPADHALGTVLALLVWPLHLLVVAAVSRARRARLWTVLTVPVLALPFLLLPFLLAAVDQTNRGVVLGYLLYGLLCRLHPRRWDPPTAGPPVSGA